MGFSVIGGLLMGGVGVLAVFLGFPILYWTLVCIEASFFRPKFNIFVGASLHLNLFKHSLMK